MTEVFSGKFWREAEKFLWFEDGHKLEGKRKEERTEGSEMPEERPLFSR